MPKTIKICFDEKLNFINLYNAFYRICKENRKKTYILKAEMDIETIICNLEMTLRNGTYRPGKYHVFTIHEPKERIIKALPFQDRIVHQWYIEEFIKPYYLKRFIKDSYACIEGRGAHLAVKNLQKYMRKMEYKNKNYYVLKCDIKKYFYNINRDILYKILEKSISDKKLLSLTKIILYDEDEKGIPIGNYTSQFFANIYLNELDKYIKYVLRVKYYVRYMDDFVLLLNTKEECRRMVGLLDNYLKNNLDLELNSKTRYFPGYQGISFCGYRVFSTHILVRGSNKNRMKRKINTWNKLYLENSLDMNYVYFSYNSWLGHISHTNGYNLKNKMTSKMIFKEEIDRGKK